MHLPRHSSEHGARAARRPHARCTSRVPVVPTPMHARVQLGGRCCRGEKLRGQWHSGFVVIYGSAVVGRAPWCIRVSPPWFVVCTRYSRMHLVEASSRRLVGAYRATRPVWEHARRGRPRSKPLRQSAALAAAAGWQDAGWRSFVTTPNAAAGCAERYGFGRLITTYYRCTAVHAGPLIRTGATLARTAAARSGPGGRRAGVCRHALRNMPSTGCSALFGPGGTHILLVRSSLPALGGLAWWPWVQARPRGWPKPFILRGGWSPRLL